MESNDEKRPKHRGRWQAQGRGVDKSVLWRQMTPPTRTAGHEMLDQLATQLTHREVRDREDALGLAHRFVDQASRTTGGATASDRPLHKTFPPNNVTNGPRIDLEIHLGTAFIPDPA